MSGRLGRGGMATSRRSVMRAIPWVLGGLAVGRGAAYAETGEVGPASAGAPLSTAAAFPLAVKRGKRHIVDATGSPFLIHDDTAWSLIAGGRALSRRAAGPRLQHHSGLAHRAPLFDQPARQYLS